MISKFAGWLSSGLLLLCAGGAVAEEPMQRAVDVAFKAAVDGTEQKYFLLLPRGHSQEKPAPLLIALHGHGSDRRQFMIPSRGETQGALAAAEKYGALYVSPDYRATTSWMGPKAEADLVQILGELKQRFRISKVILSGASMGGTASLTFAAIHPEWIDAVVSMNGTANLLEYENFQDAIQASFGGNKKEQLLEYKKRSAEYWPEKLTMPIVFTAGGKDTAVPPGSVLRLHGILKKAGRNVELIYRDTGGHETNRGDTEAAYEWAFKQLGIPPLEK